jgi:hypothetical protein
MEASSPDPPVTTFVVRFWDEWSAAGTRWRGQIDHVQSGTSARFLNLEELAEILQRFGVMPAPTPDTQGADERIDVNVADAAGCRKHCNP